jgi:gliding motility-associated-like protein
MLIAIDSASCNISDTSYVTINVLSTISTFLGNDTAFCPPGSITLDAGISGATYQWNTGATTQTIQATQTGSYWVTVTLGTCSATDTIDVDLFTFNAGGGSAEICPGSPILLNAGNPGSTYLWSNGATSQGISVSTAGIYWVQITHANCVETDTFYVTEGGGGAVMIPNVFTPNGDGVNDFYDIGTPAADLYRMEIYDRWGVMVFMSTDPAHKWDGVYNKDAATEGVYYYIIHYVNCASEEVHETGFLHLKR